ncbi:MAG TPA: sugar phosphate isomerase/epimerase [Eubacteriales bacterium]|nr:sugar phosphate isomerase/epimerase [Eubacteriales bacterium]
MKICFNQATTMKNSTLESDLDSCEKYGYDLIEIRLDKLRDYLTRHTLGDLKAYFDAHRIKPFAFNALEFINFRDKKGFEEIMNGLKFCCEAGRIIGCSRVVIVPTFDVGDKTIAEIREETVRVIHIMSDYAEPFGMNLAFEFVGYPNCSVNTFGQAYDIVKAADRANVGVVLDCFHFHAMGSRFEDLEAADAKKIFILHLDDSEDLPVGAARDNNRLMPGEGAIDLKRILSTLKKLGYDSMVSIELFRPEYWDWPDEENIRICYEKTCDTVRPFFPIG